MYYSNELSYLLGVDPSRKAQNQNDGGLNFEEISTIVQDCPGVCRVKFDLPFDGKKHNVYPLFSLVAHGAPLELVEKVFTENPFMFLDTRDIYGQTVMHYALRFNPPDIKTLHYLIHRSPHSLDAWDKQKRSPLHTACAHASWATDVVEFIIRESPKHVLAVPDKEGNLPMHLALNGMECSYAIVKNLTDRYPEALAARTANNQLPIQLAQEKTLDNGIQEYILKHTPEGDITTESFSVALRTAKYSSSLPLIKRLIDEDPTVLTKVENGQLPIEIAHIHGASKVVMQYLYQKTPNQKIPKWLSKLKPTEADVRRALKKEAQRTASPETKAVPASAASAVKTSSTERANGSLAGASDMANDNTAEMIVPNPTFWERLCCKPRIVLD